MNQGDGTAERDEGGKEREKRRKEDGRALGRCALSRTHDVEWSFLRGREKEVE